MRTQRIILLAYIVCMVGLIGVGAFAQDSPYEIILSRTEMWLTPDDTEAALERVGESPNTLSGMLERGILLFRQARYEDDEKLTREAYEYLDKLYQNVPQFKNPAMNVYVGAALSAIGGAIKKPQPSTKIKLLNDGVKVIDRAIKSLEQEDIDEALGLAYLIRANTIVAAPPFLAVFEEVIPTLKKTVFYFKRSKNFTQQEQQDLLASVYEIYATHSIATGDISRAKKYLRTGLEKASSNRLKKFMQYRLSQVE